MSYAALWCKSNYSFLEGASFPEQLVRTARDSGLEALAITDRDGVYGVVRAHVEAEACGVKLILGAQMTLEDGSTTVLLARNRQGYENLCALISAGRLRSPKGESRVGWGEIRAAAEGLVIMVPANDRTPWEDLEAACPGHLYVGYSRHRVFEDASRRRLAAEISSARGIPVVALPEVLYHSPSRRPLQDVLSCIRHKCSLDEAGEFLKPNDHFDLKAPDDFQELYADWPEAVENTRRIAASCTFSLNKIRYTYPEETLPGGYAVMSWLAELVRQGARKRYPGGTPEDVSRQIRRELEIIEALEYGGYFLTMQEIVRFCREKNILCQGRGSAANSIVCYCLGITAIDPVKMNLLFERFLSLERAEPPDIDLDIEHQRREEVIQYMYARYGRDRAAMVANFIRYRPKSAIRDVGRALGFSSVDLERMVKDLGIWWMDLEGNLERSLGPSAEKKASAATPASPEGKDLSRDLGRVSDEEAGAGLPEVPVPADRHALLGILCRQILDFPRHLSIHPGGFLLGSRPIAALVPVENASMPDRTVVQWDKYDIEAMNLFKVDLLGLGALSHLDHTMRLLKAHRNIDISLPDISAMGDDAEVFEALRRGDTVGVFQVESRAQMAMLPRMKPRCFYDLVIEISIVRPGPISGGLVHPYLRRRSGQEPVIFPHPSLEPVLGKTLGIPIFQEQVMKLAVVAADYSPGEADQLRRDMAAWRSSGKLAKHREKLITRMIAKGIRKDFAESVYQQIQGFGEYGFPESHAASFALIAYATAWFKVKYPAFFSCGLLNAWPMGFYSPASLVEDARRHGIPILPIDVTISGWDCRPEWAGAGRSVSGKALSPEGASEGLPSPGGSRSPGTASQQDSYSTGTSSAGWGIRMGFRYVKGLNREQGEAVEAMKGLGIESVDEFAARSGLDEGAMKALALSGAFASLPGNRRSQLWHSLGASREAAGGRPASPEAASFLGGETTGRRQGDMYAAAEETSDAPGGAFGTASGAASGGWVYAAEDPLEFTPLSDGESVSWDYASSLHSTRGHPLEGLREELRSLGLPDSGEVRDSRDGTACRYAGVVICRQRPGTANGVIFMTLEDEAGFVNLVIWQKVYEANRKILLSHPFLGVEGKLQSKEGTVHLIVERCFVPPVSLESMGLGSRDFR